MAVIRFFFPRFVQINSAFILFSCSNLTQCRISFPVEIFRYQLYSSRYKSRHGHFLKGKVTIKIVISTFGIHFKTFETFVIGWTCIFRKTIRLDGRKWSCSVWMSSVEGSLQSFPNCCSEPVNFTLAFWRICARWVLKLVRIWWAFWKIWWNFPYHLKNILRILRHPLDLPLKPCPALNSVRNYIGIIVLMILVNYLWYSIEEWLCSKLDHMHTTA